jgi:hypothetical protein
LLSFEILIDGRYFYNSMPELKDVKPEKLLHCLIALQDGAVLNLAARRVLLDAPDTKPKLREFFSGLFQYTLTAVPAARLPMEKICGKLGGKGTLL